MVVLALLLLALTDRFADDVTEEIESMEEENKWMEEAMEEEEEEERPVITKKQRREEKEAFKREVLGEAYALKRNRNSQKAP